MFITPLLGFKFKRQIGYGKNYKLLAAIYEYWGLIYF